MPREADGTVNRPVQDYVDATVADANTVNTEVNDMADVISHTLDPAGRIPAVRRVPFAEGMQVSDIAGQPDNAFQADLSIAGRIKLKNGTAEGTLDYNHAASYIYELPTEGGRLLKTGETGPTIEAFVPAGTKMLFGDTPPAGWTVDDIDAAGFALRLGGNTVTPGATTEIEDRGLAAVFTNPSPAQPSTVAVPLDDHTHDYRVGIQEIRYNGGNDILRAWVGASGMPTLNFNTGTPYTGTENNQTDPAENHTHVLNLRMNYYRMLVATKD